MEDTSEKDVVTPKEVGDREIFNGRYAVVRWNVSGKTTVGQVKKSLGESLPADVGMYGRVSKRRDEVRVVVRFHRKPHYTDVLKHLELKGHAEQHVYLAKLERPETWEQFVEKGVKYVQCLRGGKVFGRVGSLVPVKAEASTRVESEECSDEVEESEDDGSEGDSDEESLYGLSANMRKLMLQRDVADAKVELAEAKLEQKKVELELFSSGSTLE
jgi:hypothetical protein